MPPKDEHTQLRRLRRWARDLHFKVERDPVHARGWLVIDPTSGGIVGKRNVIANRPLALADVERILTLRLKAAGIYGKRQPIFQR